MSAAPDPLTREEDDDDLPAAIDTRPFFIETRSDTFRNHISKRRRGRSRGARARP
jgi:hypothetical protein